MGYFVQCDWCGVAMRFRRPPGFAVFCSSECICARESGLEDKLRAIPMPPEEKFLG